MGLFGDIADLFKSTSALQDDVDSMMKQDAGLVDGDEVPLDPEPDSKASEKIGRKAILDDPYFDFTQNHFLWKAKQSRIANKTLKDVSMRDWAISAIIQTRADTVLRFSRPQRLPHKMDMGFKIMKREHNDDISDEERKEISMLEDYLYHCGQKKHTPKNDRMIFSEFLKVLVRDAITFGHVAVEKIKTRGGGLHRFRPLPAESMYHVSPLIEKKTLKQELDQARQTYENTRKGDNNPNLAHKRYDRKIEYYKYIQMSMDNKTLAIFGDDEMIFKLFNPQNFADSLGYCYSPLELAIINVTNHLNIENYNANFFTHGYAARGILHLKGTVTQQQLSSFRRQFYNQITGAQHAWRTPIVAGLDEVDWIQLSGSAKEMEYLQYNDHILRAICAQFSIDPVEIGYDYLSRGSGASRTSGLTGEEKLQASKDRGLIPILMFFEDLVNNDILPALNEDWAAKYKFVFTGYTDESPQTNVSLLQAEMTVHSSMNDLLRDSYKPLMKDMSVADLPLNQAFWALVEKHMTKGEIREYFFGDEGASKRRELAYFPADPAFMGWQQMLMTIDQQVQQQKAMQQQQEAEAQAQQQQAEAQTQQQQVESRHAEGKHQREQEKHEAEMKEIEARHRDAVKQASLKEIAKKQGLGDKALEIGGKPVKNPINDAD